MKKNAPIVLLTDFGNTDTYAGIVKASILSVNPGACIVDLTHSIPPQNIKRGCYVLGDAFSYFPKHSIFVSVVDPGVGSSRRVAAVKTDNSIFIAPDNGLLTLVLNQNPKAEIREVTNTHYMRSDISNTFHARDIMAPAAAHLSINRALFSKLGARVYAPVKLNLPEPLKKRNRIEGEIIYFDYYGNAFTNIRKTLNRNWGAASIQLKNKSIGKMANHYAERQNIFALFNSNDRLEIACYKSSAKEKAHLKEGDRVAVIFHE